MFSANTTVIESCQFYKTIAVAGGSVYIQKVLYLHIKKCSFINTKAAFKLRQGYGHGGYYSYTDGGYGGSLCIQNVGYFQIKNCSFNYTKAKNSGGSVYIGVDFSNFHSLMKVKL